MLKKMKDVFYQSISKAINDKKKKFNLNPNEILNDGTRVSKIINSVHNAHYPYLISQTEYMYLIQLFLYNTEQEFKDAKILNTPEAELLKKCDNSFDKMLWDHIDWDKMFQDVIAILSETDIVEKQKELEELEKQEKPKKWKELEELENQVRLIKLFEKTLVDYAPYALIRYDELPFDYARIFIFPEERAEKRKKAIERVYLRHGSETFKQSFLKKFSGKTLREFDKGFYRFISDYLEKKIPDKYSLGLQAYEAHLSHSKFVVRWKEFLNVEFEDTDDEKSILLRKYIKSNQEHMLELAEYQQEFDNLLIDIK